MAMYNLNISYHKATIIHSNKYNNNFGYYFYHIFFSNLLQDVVFKLEDSRELAHTFRNSSFTFYTGQKIILISINDIVVAYIDENTNSYHYLSNNLARDLKLGIPLTVVQTAILSIGFCLILSFVLKADLFLFFLILNVLYFTYKKIENYIIEKEIDKLIITK